MKTKKSKFMPIRPVKRIQIPSFQEDTEVSELRSFETPRKKSLRSSEDGQDWTKNIKRKVYNPPGKAKWTERISTFRTKISHNQQESESNLDGSRRQPVALKPRMVVTSKGMELLNLIRSKSEKDKADAQQKKKRPRASTLLGLDIPKNRQSVHARRKGSKNIPLKFVDKNLFFDPNTPWQQEEAVSPSMRMLAMRKSQLNHQVNRLSVTTRNMFMKAIKRKKTFKSNDNGGNADKPSPPGSPFVLNITNIEDVPSEVESNQEEDDDDKFDGNLDLSVYSIPKSRLPDDPNLKSPLKPRVSKFDRRLFVKLKAEREIRRSIIKPFLGSMKSSMKNSREDQSEKARRINRYLSRNSSNFSSQFGDNGSGKNSFLSPMSRSPLKERKRLRRKTRLSIFIKTMHAFSEKKKMLLRPQPKTKQLPSKSVKGIAFYQKTDPKKKKSRMRFNQRLVNDSMRTLPIKIGDPKMSHRNDARNKLKVLTKLNNKEYNKDIQISLSRYLKEKMVQERVKETERLKFLQELDQQRKVLNKYQEDGMYNKKKEWKNLDARYKYLLSSRSRIKTEPVVFSHRSGFLRSGSDSGLEAPKFSQILMGKRRRKAMNNLFG